MQDAPRIYLSLTRNSENPISDKKLVLEPTGRKGADNERLMRSSFERKETGLHRSVSWTDDDTSDDAVQTNVW